MEATQSRLPFGKLLHSRGGTLALAAGVAALAAIVLVVFLSGYKNDVRGGAAPTSALVASALIPKGTSGDVVIGDTLFEPTSVASDQLKDGAIEDASAIAGKVAVRDVYPGQQITADDFAGKGDPLRGQLNGNQRAMNVPIDVAHGLVGTVRTGDRVDVYAGFNAASGSRGTTRPVVRTLLQNVLVLRAPEEAATEGSPGQEGAVTLRVDEKQAAALAFAADNGKVWLALRPPAGASQNRPATVDLQSLLSGVPTVEEDSK